MKSMLFAIVVSALSEVVWAEQQPPERPLELILTPETARAEIDGFKSQVMERIDAAVRGIGPSGTNRLAFMTGNFGAPPPGSPPPNDMRSRPAEGVARGTKPPVPPGGAMRDDPSDAARYSGVEEVTGSRALKDVALSSNRRDTAPVYVKTGGNLTLSGGRITSSASGANAVLAIGKDARADVSDVSIRTTADSSRGLYAFNGGEIRARCVDISTAGAHCAALATDRGGGRVSLDGGRLETGGDGSPCLYSTGELTARNVQGRAMASEAMVIEGRNSIVLENSDLVGCRKCGVMLYQSFSGDAEEGVSRLEARKSKLRAEEGPLFFVTNTRAEIDISGCDFGQRAGNAFLKVAPARWGRAGENGGSVTLVAKDQICTGDVEVSSGSSAQIVLGEGARLTGAINGANAARDVKVCLSKKAMLVLTGDSFITELTNDDPTGGNIVMNGHRLVVSGVK